MNPHCSELACNISSKPLIFYGQQFVGENTIHILYSSFGNLTISMIETRRGYDPQINYTALFQGDYSRAITFGILPANSLTLIIRRLIKFNDVNDTGRLNEDDPSNHPYSLSNLATNLTRNATNIIQPSFILPLNDVNRELHSYKKVHQLIRCIF